MAGARYALGEPPALSGLAQRRGIEALLTADGRSTPYVAVYDKQKTPPRRIANVAL